MRSFEKYTWQDIIKVLEQYLEEMMPHSIEILDEELSTLSQKEIYERYMTMERVTFAKNVATVSLSFFLCCPCTTIACTKAMQKEIRDLGKEKAVLLKAFRRYSLDENNLLNEGELPFKKKQLDYVSRLLEIRQIISYQVKGEEYPSKEAPPHPQLKQFERTLKNMARSHKVSSTYADASQDPSPSIAMK